MSSFQQDCNLRVGNVWFIEHQLSTKKGHLLLAPLNYSSSSCSVYQRNSEMHFCQTRWMLLNRFKMQFSYSILHSKCNFVELFLLVNDSFYKGKISFFWWSDIGYINCTLRQANTKQTLVLFLYFPLFVVFCFVLLFWLVLFKREREHKVGWIRRGEHMGGVGRGE